MPILRSSQLTALQELHVAFQYSIDQFLNAENAFDELDVTDREPPIEWKSLINSRQQVVDKLKAQIFDEGDLPRMPNDDLEQSEEFFEHAAALLVDDQRKELVQNRVDTEDELKALLEATVDDLSDFPSQLQEALKNNIKQVRSYLVSIG